MKQKTKKNVAQPKTIKHVSDSALRKMSSEERWNLYCDELERTNVDEFSYTTNMRRTFDNMWGDKHDEKNTKEISFKVTDTNLFNIQIIMDLIDKQRKGF